MSGVNPNGDDQFDFDRQLVPFGHFLYKRRGAGLILEQPLDPVGMIGTACFFREWKEKNRFLF